MWSRPRKPVRKPKPSADRRLRLVGDAGVVEHELAERVLEILVVGGVDREQAGEHHRLDGLEPGQRRGARTIGVGDGVADARVRDVLDRRGEDADLAGLERVDLHGRGLADRDHRALVRLLGPQNRSLVPFVIRPADHADEHDDAAELIEPAVEDQRGQRRLAIGLRRRDPLDDRLEHLVDADAGLRRHHARVLRVEADRVLDLLLDLVGARDRQVDLVEDRDDLEVVVERDVDVGERLRLHALSRIDHEQRALARGERPARPRSGSRRGRACRSGGTDTSGRRRPCSGAGPTAP